MNRGTSTHEEPFGSLMCASAGGSASTRGPGPGHTTPTAQMGTRRHTVSWTFKRFPVLHVCHELRSCGQHSGILVSRVYPGPGYTWDTCAVGIPGTYNLCVFL